MAASHVNTANHKVLYKGSCACQRMKYEGTALPKGAQNCHCVTCQKLSGGPYQSFADFEASSIAFSDTKKSVRYDVLPQDTTDGITFLRFQKGAERAFCADCWSPLAMRYMHDYDTVGLTLGTIDEATILDQEVREALKPRSQIFVSQQAGYCDMSKDDLPRHERFPGRYEEDMLEWEQRHA